MPWKYQRITRWCTCVTPGLEEEEKMRCCSGSFWNRCVFVKKPAVKMTAGFSIPYLYFLFWDFRPDRQAYSTQRKSKEKECQ